MGKIAEALRSNLQELAQSDARSLRAIDQELKASRGPQPPTELKTSVVAQALLGSGSFESQTAAALKKLCKAHGIKGYSKLKKPDLCKLLKAKGVTPPPPPLESFSKKELVTMLKQVLGLS